MAETKKSENISEPEDLVTQKDAAEACGRTIASVNELVRRGRIMSYEKYGKTLVSLSEVRSFKPDKGGRPPKAKANNKVSKKGKK